VNSKRPSVSETASFEAVAGAGPESFTVIPERLLLTPCEEATLTLPEIDAVVDWGLDSPTRANPGTALTMVQSNTNTIRRANFDPFSNLFNNTFPQFLLAIPRSSRLNMELPGEWVS
jgi:hypothetical protein